MTPPDTQSAVQNAEGTFGWIDLASTDMEGTKAFYSQMFGWTFEDTPMGEEFNYTTFKLHGKSVAGGGTMPAEQQEQGMPSYWGTYVMVSDADAVTAQAEAAGATIMVPPMDIMEEGRMGIIQDPTGGIFGIWQPRNHKGFQIAHVPGAVVWNELMTRDPETAAKFYHELFGWTTQSEPSTESSTEAGEETPYRMFQKGDLWAGGLFTMGPGLAEVPANWSIYIGVEDCDAALEKAVRLGATPLMDPLDTFAGRLVTIRDPQGAVINIIQENTP